MNLMVVTTMKSYLASCSKTLSRPLTVPGRACPSHGTQGLEYSTTLAGNWRPFLLGQSTCFHLAIHLLELEAFIAVAVTLGIAEVITGRGPTALFRRLFSRGFTPVGHRARSLAEVLALHAKFLTAAGQDILARGPGALGS